MPFIHEDDETTNDSEIGCDDESEYHLDLGQHNAHSDRIAVIESIHSCQLCHRLGTASAQWKVQMHSSRVRNHTQFAGPDNWIVKRTTCCQSRELVYCCRMQICCSRARRFIELGSEAISFYSLAQGVNASSIADMHCQAFLSSVSPYETTISRLLFTVILGG